MEKNTLVKSLFNSYLERDITFKYLLESLGYTLVGSRALGLSSLNSDYDYAIEDEKLHNILCDCIKNEGCGDINFIFKHEHNINYKGKQVVKCIGFKHKSIDFFYTSKILTIEEQKKMHLNKKLKEKIETIEKAIADKLNCKIELKYSIDNEYYTINIK